MGQKTRRYSTCVMRRRGTFPALHRTCSEGSSSSIGSVPTGGYSAAAVGSHKVKMTAVMPTCMAALGTGLR